MTGKNRLSIEIVNEQKRLPVRTDRIRATLRYLLKEEGIRKGALEISIVDDPTIHQLNVQFLGHDYPTDVLAFEMDSNSEEALLEGNVIVSADTAADRAAEFNMLPENELLLYMIHGTLHLLGYDDHTPEDAPLMREKENFYMASAMK